MYAYADSFGLDLADPNRLNVMLACSLSLPHSVNEEFGSTLASLALSQTVNAWKALSTNFRWWV